MTFGVCAVTMAMKQGHDKRGEGRFGDEGMCGSYRFCRIDTVFLKGILIEDTF